MNTRTERVDVERLQPGDTILTNGEPRVVLFDDIQALPNGKVKRVLFPRDYGDGLIHYYTRR